MAWSGKALTLDGKTHVLYSFLTRVCGTANNVIKWLEASINIVYRNNVIKQGGCEHS